MFVFISVGEERQLHIQSRRLWWCERWVGRLCCQELCAEAVIEVGFIDFVQGKASFLCFSAGTKFMHYMLHAFGIILCISGFHVPSWWACIWMLFLLLVVVGLMDICISCHFNVYNALDVNIVLDELEIIRLLLFIWYGVYIVLDGLESY